MVIGLDYHNTVDKHFKLFKGLAHTWMTAGIDVYIITALKTPTDPQVKKEIERCKIMKTGVEITYFRDYAEIPQLKLRACQKLGVTIMFDDSEAVCKFLNRSGIVTAQIR